LAKPPQPNKPGAQGPTPPPVSKNPDPKPGEKGRGTEKGKQPWRDRLASFFIDRGPQVHENRRSSWLERFAVIFAFFAFSATAYQGWISRDTEHRQLRAYVGLVPGDVENFGDLAKQRFTFVRKNYGLTPAYDLVVSQFGESVIVYGQPIPVISPNPPPDILRGNVTLFPSGELPMHLIGVGISKDMIDKFMSDDNFRFVYTGTVKYRDAFDNTHFTNFCWMYKRNAMTAKDVDWCQGYNDSN
jgi:hypothetical protein